MTTALPLWHLELVPGQSYPLMVVRDFKITNAALGEEIADENGRSVVKIVHQPVNPRELADDSDSDDEFSDEDFEDEEEEEEVDMEALKAAINGKKSKKADAAEEEDDEEEDEEEDEDFEADAQTTAVLCSLIPGKIEQAQLNLVFVKEEVVMFEVTGKNTVHLMGNYINQDTHSPEHDDYDDMSDEEDFSLDEDSEDEDISMAEEASHRFEEVKEDPKSKKTEAAKETANKKRKAETQENDSKRSTASAAEKKAVTPNPAEKKPEQAAKKQKTEAAKPAEKKKEADQKPEQKSAKKQTLPSGLIIEDFKIGDGPVAKKGKRLSMRYIGKLMNGKQFDANTSGAPFNFRLGAGEVIKGWDQGLEGMKVGGERKLTIPAKLAYGSQKIPGIPAQSTLQFEVKLVNVK